MKVQYYSTNTDGSLEIKTVIGVNEVIIEGRLVHIHHPFGIYDIKDLKHLYIEDKKGFSIEGSNVKARYCADDGCIIDIHSHKKLNISFRYNCLSDESSSEGININGKYINNPYSVCITHHVRSIIC